MRVFINQPNATARTTTVGNPAFAGAFGFIGEDGSRKNDAAHCPECAHLGHTREHTHHHAHHDHDHGHHQGPHLVEERFDVELHLSDTLLKAIAEEAEVTLRLVAVDSDGNDVPAEKIRLDEIELEVE